ncbi:MAG TPA: hypothetical protein VG964_01120 [Candidatus Saccharimonadales bacterium]|nr:hypothetical protein [Candidatus Saccharimonadales bacterium]
MSTFSEGDPTTRSGWEQGRLAEEAAYEIPAHTVHLGTVILDLGVGSETQHREIENELAAEERDEIEELSRQGQPETAVAKFEGSDKLAIVLTDDEMSRAKRRISNARSLGMDAMGAFAPMHFAGGSVVTVDREGIHIMPEGDK